MIVAALKNLNVDRIDVHDAVCLVAMARATESQYAVYGVVAPDWLTEGIATLDAEIRRKRRDMLMARQKEVEASLTQLQTREEKRAKLEAEQAALRDALGPK